MNSFFLAVYPLNNGCFGCIFLYNILMLISHRPSASAIDTCMSYSSATIQRMWNIRAELCSLMSIKWKSENCSLFVIRAMSLINNISFTYHCDKRIEANITLHQVYMLSIRIPPENVCELNHCQLLSLLNLPSKLHRQVISVWRVTQVLKWQRHLQCSRILVFASISHQVQLA